MRSGMLQERLEPNVEERRVESGALRDAAKVLHDDGWRLATIVASNENDSLQLRYCFYATKRSGWRILRANVGSDRTIRSLTPVVIAADWFEREIEDLFSIHFLQHPRLGDFVLHNDTWAEDVGIMRASAEAGSVNDKRAARPWRPHRVLQEEGAFVMPVGPIFSDEAESALFLLETVGEDVVRSLPRLFFKYRAIEKLAEGKSAEDALLLVERCNGTSAIGNGWAYCCAVERAIGVEPPERAVLLRALFAEIERIRHHAASIREICDSTALVVATSQLLWIEERLLRCCGELAGHRYLFGVLAIGGVTRDFDSTAVEQAIQQIVALCKELLRAGQVLADTSSFLDRIERVGIIDPFKAHVFELVGPVARASGVAADMRAIQPYAPYSSLGFRVPLEEEGDGYARLRLLFAEVEQSLQLLSEISGQLRSGPITSEIDLHAGSSLGWTEAPRGASVAWVTLDGDGMIARLRLTPPSFQNWHGFHLATEGFTFQDFPIILATLDLSVAENDR
jgi:formate hydrogenlyase subunit 5